MTLKELIEYLQQEVADGTPEGTEMGRMQLQLGNKRIMAMPNRTIILERGQAPLRIDKGTSLSQAVKEHKETKVK